MNRLIFNLRRKLADGGAGYVLAYDGGTRWH